MGNKCVIIEVDENQHLNYDCSCENKMAMAHRPIIFIRFNMLILKLLKKYHLAGVSMEMAYVV